MSKPTPFAFGDAPEPAHFAGPHPEAATLIAEFSNALQGAPADLKKRERIGKIARDAIAAIEKVTTPADRKRAEGPVVRDEQPAPGPSSFPVTTSS